MAPTTLETERGHVIWHCSEEDGLPDVGLSLGLGGGRVLWIGELANATLAEHGIDVKETGDGWWLAMFGGDRSEAHIAALVVDATAAQEVFDHIAALVRPSSERLSSDRAREGSPKGLPTEQSSSEASSTRGDG